METNKNDTANSTSAAVVKSPPEDDAFISCGSSSGGSSSSTTKRRDDEHINEQQQQQQQQPSDVLHDVDQAAGWSQSRNHDASSNHGSSGTTSSDDRKHDRKQPDLVSSNDNGSLSALVGEVSHAELDAYGLNGILKTVRSTQTPLSILSLGTDLTTLGLNLNTPE